VTSVERFHINHVASATWALICPVTVTCDLLTLKPVRIIALGVGNLPTSYGTFRSRPTGLSDARRDIATLTFDLGGLSVIRVVVFHLCIKLEVRRPSRSEDMTHIR